MATYTQQFTNDTDGYDTYGSTNVPTANQDGGTELVTGKSNSSGFTRHSWIKWDFSSLSPASIISSAVISLYILSNAANGANDLQAFRLKRNWVETEATWNNYASGSAWSTAGGCSHANDIDTTALGAVSVPGTPSAGTEYQISLTAAEVQKMIDGTYSNYGFAFKMQDESGSYEHQWASSRHGTAGYHPKIVITYDVPSAPGMMVVGLFKRWQRRSSLYQELLAKGAIPLGRQELMPI